MKGFCKLAALSLLLATAIPANADDGSLVTDQSATQGDNGTEALSKYLKYLGGYLGYDLTKDPSANAAKITSDLLDAAATQMAQSSIFNAFLGARPVNASEGTKKFVPDSVPQATAINQYANATFADFGKAGAAGGSGFSAQEQVDQKEFQPDPVNQMVLNILATPDYSNCLVEDGTIDTRCTLLYQNKVLANTIGTLPVYTDPAKSFFSFNYNKPLLSQLNSNSLLGPFLYSSEGASQNATPNNSGNTGLVSQSPIQDAGNFIRYASGMVMPVPQPKYSDYAAVYLTAYPAKAPTTAADQAAQLQAQTTLNNYFANLRVFAAQSSVTLSNLYYIMSKRMPQTASDSKEQSSQALSEFKMATWRIKPADSSANTKETAWLTKINTASEATVQKEIAILLAEINYQLYLTRQQEERTLLANTIMLAQSTKIGQPTPFAAPTNTGSEGNSSE